MALLGDIDVVLVDRAMAAAAPPTFTEVGPLVGASGITIQEPLNQPEILDLTIPPASQDSAVLAKFTDLLDASEVWVHERTTGARLFAGPLLGYRPQLSRDGMVWTIRAEGILGYTKRMLAPEPDDADLVFTGVDQANIAKGLIDYWQALSYGDYGIDTSSVTTTGVTRDRTYPVPEQHVVAQRLAELAAVNDGFDYHIDSTTRELVISYPSRGTDKTATVIIDGRSIVQPQSQISVGPEDIISDGFAVSDSGLVSRYTDAAMREGYGRSAMSSSWQGITVQATLDDYAQRLQEQRNTPLHTLGAGMYPIGLGWQDFEPGDLVEFSYDYGGGLLTEQRRVVNRQVSISSTAELIGVALE